MSRALAARIERLERRKANEAPMRQFGVFGGVSLWRTEICEGVVICLPMFEPGMFGERCRAQQDRLFQELAKYAETLEIEGSTNGKDTGPLSVGGTVDELSPLSPGKKRRRFIEINGKEIDTFALRGIQ